MADITTIAELGTAGGTLVLAMATFASVRSANRAARVAERALLLGERPMLVPSRAEDPDEEVSFLNERVHLPGGGAVVVHKADRMLLAVSLRNVGAGVAVIQGWQALPGRLLPSDSHGEPSEYRPHNRDLYIAPGDTGFWQGAIRDAADPLHAAMGEALEREDELTLDILYTDQEGNQSFITRFLVSRSDDGWGAAAVRHWALDGSFARG